MPQTDRGRSIVEHLAKVVMGWRWCESTHRFWDYTTIPIEPLPMDTLDLDYWADAGMVWERAREEMGIEINLCAQPGSPWEAVWFEDSEMSQVSEADSGPRALCYAVAKATGWVEPKENTDDK